MKFERKSLWFALVVLGIPLSLAADTIEINYESLQKLLETRSPRVEASRLQIEAASARTGSFGRSYVPKIEIHAAQESFKVGVGAQKSQPAYGAEANVNLFNGGRDRIESQIRELAADRKIVEHKRITAEELQKVRNLFWEILYSQEKVFLFEATSKMNKQNLLSAEKRIRGGVATESDRFEFEIKAVELKRELAEYSLKLSTQKNDLAGLLDISENTKMRFPSKISHEHDIEALLQYSEKDSDFLSKENEIQASENELASKSVGKNWWPKLDAFAVYNQFNEREKEFSDAAERTETVIGLKVSMNLAEGLEGRRESAALQKEALAFKKMSDLQKREIEINLKNEITTLKFLHDQVHDAEENIARAEKYYKLTQSEYSRGVKNSPDMLGASEKIFEMNAKRIEIIRDFQIAKAHVLSKIGK